MAALGLMSQETAAPPAPQSYPIFRDEKLQKSLLRHQEEMERLKAGAGSRNCEHHSRKLEPEVQRLLRHLPAADRSEKCRWKNTRSRIGECDNSFSASNDNHLVFSDDVTFASSGDQSASSFKCQERRDGLRDGQLVRRGHLRQADSFRLRQDARTHRVSRDEQDLGRHEVHTLQSHHVAGSELRIASLHRRGWRHGLALEAKHDFTERNSN